MKKMNKICEMILTLDENDYADAERVIKQQKEYISPLKPVTQGWQNDLGDYNEKVVAKIKELHEILKAGAEIEEP